MSALLKRFWTDHRLASVISLALLFLGLLIKPWTLVPVLAVAFGGPLLQRLDSFSTSPLTGWRRGNWAALALLSGATLLALTGKGIGHGALLLALVPVAFVLVTDRKILKGGPITASGLSASASIEPASETPIASAQEEAPTGIGPQKPLVGSELLNKIQELGDTGKSDLVRACGYISVEKNGAERLNFTAFYEALLEAKGVNMGPIGQGGRKLSYVATVQSNGDLIVETDYTSMLGLEPGDKFEIKLGRKQIRLIPTEDSDEDGETSAEEDEQILAEWQELDSEEIVSRLKGTEKINETILTFLASSNDWEVRRAVAWHENTPDEVLETLAEDDDSDVSEATRERGLPKKWRFMSEEETVEALESSDIALETIENLSTSENWSIRQAVACSPSTPESILTNLKEDEDDDVREAATIERQLPLDWRFLNVWSKVIRLEQGHVEPAILEILSKSYAVVRRAVALHPTTPEHVISVLREDDTELVQSGVRERDDTPDPWKSMYYEERISALKSDEVADSVLVLLARSVDWRIRQAVAMSPLTPPAILKSLAGDDVHDVRWAVKERDLPDSWRQLDEDTRVEQLSEGAVEPHVLEILSTSSNWTVRQAVAKNSETTEEVLKVLLKDNDRDVRLAANEGLKRLRRDEVHNIYIKDVPGGSIRFGTLEQKHSEQLLSCIMTQELTDELSEIGDNSSGQLNELHGVFEPGLEGVFGYEGTLVFSSDQPALGPSYNDEGSFEDGAYVVMMRLSDESSLSFDFTASGGFDADEFEEIVVPVRLPEEIVHGLYGWQDFNIITGFRFRGESVEEYKGEVEVRGHVDELTFFVIKDGITTILYRNCKGEEEWCEKEEAKTAISSFL